MASNHITSLISLVSQLKLKYYHLEIINSNFFLISEPFDLTITKFEVDMQTSSISRVYSDEILLDITLEIDSLRNKWPAESVPSVHLYISGKYTLCLVLDLLFV